MAKMVGRKNDVTNIDAAHVLCANVMVACGRARFDSSTCGLVEEALHMAVYALQSKGEPKKPTGLRKWHEGYVGDCPLCGRVVGFAQRYCHNCTLPLDWSEVLALPCEDEEET